MKGHVLYSEYVRLYRSVALSQSLRFLQWAEIGPTQQEVWNRLARIWKLRAKKQAKKQADEQTEAIRAELRDLKRSQRRPLSLTREDILARHEEFDAEQHFLIEDQDTEIEIAGILTEDLIQ